MPNSRTLAHPRSMLLRRLNALERVEEPDNRLRQAHRMRIIEGNCGQRSTGARIYEIHQSQGRLRFEELADGDCLILFRFTYDQRGHGFKFQTMVTPDGITSSLYGPVTGNRHDAQIFTQSMMEKRPRLLFDLRHQRVGGCHHHIYGDAAYANSLVVQRPFSRVSANEEQLRQNRRISSVRIAVKNEFAHATTLFAYLDFARTLRSMQSPISAYYVVATLLKNIHVCMNGGNQNSKRFGVMPSSLETYMNGLLAQSQ
ncbi:hypothetical protein G6F56_004136 [Rhizopus delemar]|nr:hypothetical protein G6F56_004136 [Rhizopus delemar]